MNDFGTSNEEKKLLEKLASGLLDGIVGNDLTTSGGSSIWITIKNGIPVQLKQGPNRKIFNGKENEVIEGAIHTLREWLTDEDKLEFLRKFGWLIKKDADVLAYSAKFKPKK